MWRSTASALIALMLAAPLAADQRGKAAARRTTTTAKCASDLGMGAKSGRQFCDVLITKAGAESVTMPLPAHNGTATLKFDLHNRFIVPLGTPDPAVAFARNAALIVVKRSTGEPLARAAVSGEFRTLQDLFDRISGGGPGNVKAVAPGPAVPYEITIPSTVTGITIAGVSVEVTTRSTRGMRDNEGTPVAIVSNLRIEYTPR
jgi:hypothetical protein